MKRPLKREAAVPGRVRTLLYTNIVLLFAISAALAVLSSWNARNERLAMQNAIKDAAAEHRDWQEYSYQVEQAVEVLRIGDQARAITMLERAVALGRKRRVLPRRAPPVPTCGELLLLKLYKAAAHRGSPHEVRERYYLYFRTAYPNFFDFEMLGVRGQSEGRSTN